MYNFFVRFTAKNGERMQRVKAGTSAELKKEAEDACREGETVAEIRFAHSAGVVIYNGTHWRENTSTYRELFG